MTLVPVDPADADTYFAQLPRDAAWTAVTDPDVWLAESYRLLSALCLDEAKECCGKKVADVWTEANAELALALSKSPDAIVGGGASASAGAGADVIKRVAVGSLSVEYAVGQTASSTTKTVRYGVDAPTVLQRFPWLGDILGCYLKDVHSGGSARVIARVRS